VSRPLGHTAIPLGRPARGELLIAAMGALVVLLLLTFVLWPVLRVLWASLAGPTGLSLASFRAFFGAGRPVRVLIDTVVVAGLSTVLTVLVALVLAGAVTRTRIPGRRFVSVVVLLPLVSPPFLASLALILLFGRDGVARRWLDWSIYGAHGIVTAQVFTFLPQAWLLLAGMLGKIDTSLEEAAENLGTGPLGILRRITLALARPGLASAALVVFILCLSDFANPVLVGGPYRVLATEIYTRAADRTDLVSAATMSVILILPCLVACLLNARWAGTWPGVWTNAVSETALRPMPPALRWPLVAVAASVVLMISILYGLIALGSVVRLWSSDWSLSLAHYRFVSTGDEAWPIWNSLRLAVLSGVVGTALALPTAYLLEWKRANLALGARIIEALGLLATALPGPVLGVGYLLAFDLPWVSPTGTLCFLVASVVFWKLPAAVGAGVGALRRLDPAMEEAAVSLGAGAVRTFTRILAPLLTGTASSIFVYFFINGMVTVGAVILLVSPGVNLGSVALLAQIDRGLPGAACALATILVAIVLGALLAVRLLIGGDRMTIGKL
jgi:iron(III) transport system permease protein